MKHGFGYVSFGKNLFRSFNYLILNCFIIDFHCLIMVMKKHLLFLVFLSFFPILLYGQFNEPQRISPLVFGVTDTKMVDVDGDTDIDILVSSANDGKLFWFENDGNGNFPNHHILMDSGEGRRFMAASDYNRDGAVDIAISKFDFYGYVTPEILTNDGSGNFTSSPLPILSQIEDGRSIVATDMDQDGWDDLLVGDSRTNSLACWIKNDGTGHFSQVNNIPIPATGMQVLGLYDVNSDGYYDILCEKFDTLFGLLTNGNANTFTWETLSGEIAYPIYGVGDFDGDGDTDILMEGNAGAGWDDLLWLENDGTHHFFNQHLLLHVSDPINWAAVYDLDRDSIDEIIVSYEALLMYDIDSQGNYTIDTISHEYSQFSTMDLADFNADGNIDVLFEGSLIILKGNGTLSNWDDITRLNTPFSSFDFRLVDIDGDKDLDLITGNGSGQQSLEIMKYSNGAFENNSEIVDREKGPYWDIFAKDYDGDSLIDIIYPEITSGKLKWARNMGGAFAQPQVIVDDSLYWFATGLEDFDNDGDMDALRFKTSNSQGSLSFYRNNGNGFGPEEVLAPVHDASSYHYVSTFDLENDGDMDAVASYAVYTGGYSQPIKLVVFVNDGTGNFQVIDLNDTTVGWDPIISACDFDQDGDNDLLLNVSHLGAQVAVYEYDQGTFIKHIVDHPNYIYQPGAACAIDVDNDGLKDILCIDASTVFHEPEDGVYWYKNLGNLQFSSAYLSHFNQSIYMPKHIEVLDYDNDGDDDLFFSEQEGGIYYLKNEFWGSYRMQGHVFYDADTSGSFTVQDSPISFMGLDINPVQSAFFTNATGEYNALSSPGTHTVTPDIDTNYWTITTGANYYSVALDSATPIVTGLDFGVIQNGIQPNANLEITPPWVPCNITGNLWISLANVGNTILSGSLEIVMDTLLNFSGAYPFPSSISGNTLQYNITSLDYYEHKGITIRVTMPNHTAIGQPLSFQATFTDSSGLVVAGTVVDTLTCAYDPNDKKELTGIGPQGFIEDGQWLEYIVRFQNTGNGTATDVVIRDPLSDYLDWRTLTPIAWSHNPEVSVEPDGDAVFKFLNIMLPDSGANFADSQGFIKFKIKADSNLLPGTIVNNTAHIIFDFNPPVVTNTTINTIECYESDAFEISHTGELLISPFSNAVNQQWYLDGMPIPGAISKNLIPDEAGVYTVVAIVPGDCEVRSPGYLVTAINDAAVSPSAIIYPNPFTETATIMFNYPLDGRQDIVIADLLGREVYRKSSLSGNKFVISNGDTGGKGFFFLYLEGNGDKIFLSKFIVK